MKNTVSRIKEFIDFKGLSVRKFEQKMGFSNGSFASQFKNNRNIGSDKIENILRVYKEINPEWLLTGKGSMLKEDKDISILEKPNNIRYNRTHKSIKHSNNALLRIGLRLDEIIKWAKINFQTLANKLGIDYLELMKIVNGEKAAPESLLNKIGQLFPSLNPVWLHTGKGSMLKENKDISTLEQSLIGYNNSNTAIGTGAIPLVSQTAAAGFGNENFSITEQDVKEYYVVPKFKHNRIDFMVEVRGNSMYPKYNSGDVIACTILKESTFIQWNKPHLIATREQGLLVKRILPSKEKEFVVLKSDNKDYPEFEVLKKEITGIAIVVGVIRLE